MDAISQAAQNVSILLNRKLQTVPIPIKSVKKQGDTNLTDTDSGVYKDLIPTNIVKVYEIWKIFLERNNSELDYVFIVLSANNTLQGYKNGIWSNIRYRGFYTTQEEAINEIEGYLR